MSMWLDNVRARRRRQVLAELERAETKAKLLARIEDVCLDIDVWRDEQPGTAIAAARERLGEKPTLHALRVEYGLLVRQASLRDGVDGEAAA